MFFFFAFSIAEVNADVEWVFSHVFSLVDKEQNRLGPDALCSLLITKNYVQTIGSCLDLQIENIMMACIKSSHRKYIERTEAEKKRGVLCP